MTSLASRSSFPRSSQKAKNSRHNKSFGSSKGILVRGEHQRDSSALEIFNQADEDSVNSEQQLALRMDKETRPHHHLLRLLKEMDVGDETKGEAVASLIGDFERDVTLIQRKIQNEKLLLDSAANPPPLPPGWVALEDPDSGDIYYANEATGYTTWDRPSIGSEFDDSALSNFRSSDNESDGEDEDRTRESPLSQSKEEGHNRIGGGLHDKSKSKSQNEHWSPSTFNDSQNEEESVSSSGHDSDGYNDRSRSFSSDHDNIHNESHNEHDNSSDSYQSGQTSVEDDDEGLPEGWYSAIDPDSNERYYCNDETGESQWDRPELPADQASQESSQPDENHDQSWQDKEEEDDNDEEEVSGDLPQGWEAILDPSSGDYYYYNWDNGETTWDKPAADDVNQIQRQTSSDSEGDNGLPENWFAVDDPASGDTYYYNEVTNETSWDRPVVDTEANNLIVYEEDSVTSSKY